MSFFLLVYPINHKRHTFQALYKQEDPHPFLFTLSKGPPTVSLAPFYLFLYSKFLTVIKMQTSRVEVEGKKIAPKGHFVVYVGNEMTRFVVPISFLKNPLFKKLLDKAAEEYGFDHTSGLTLPCDEASFRVLVGVLSK